ncbi:unnamed protein product [Lactuca virosa]|uniref:Uncharacterized protein n=1 Tax=Lactuca virosa TaxID=75947 RepID=A0AAU9PU15_9ASTR|nr:unnamed protein product [Lactuca virosa]
MISNMDTTGKGRRTCGCHDHRNSLPPLFSFPSIKQPKHPPITSCATHLHSQQRKGKTAERSTRATISPSPSMLQPSSSLSPPSTHSP